MPDNLPAPLTSFIGREREIDDVRRLLAGTRLLTITGAGGVGKTRLALQVAAGLSDQFADGVWWAELAALADPALVPSTVAGALGLREERGRPLLTTLPEYLHSRSLLLLLDNCEHLVAACAALAEALLRACPRLRILVTSRQPLGITGETAWRVPPMALPPAESHAPSGSGTNDTLLATCDAVRDREDSVRLFADRAAATNPPFHLTERSIAAAVEICRRLDGIPLAIELAAARLRTLTAEQIAERLDDRLRLLTTGSRTALPRHQTLRGTLDWSYDLLSEPERALLRRLAVFAGGWTLEAAEAVNSPESGVQRPASNPGQRTLDAGLPTLDLLARLVDKSLVQAEERDGEARYRLLETLRQYGLEHLEASGEADAARHRHAECYLALAEEAQPHLRGPRQAEWLRQLALEHDNLRAALDWQGAHDPERGLRLAAALRRFWDMHGDTAEGQERLTTLLARAGSRGRAAAAALHGLGTLGHKQGDLSAAYRCHEGALAIYRELDDRAGTAEVLSSLALVLHDQGEPKAAFPLAKESLTIMRELGDDWGVSMALGNLALIVKNLGEIAASVPLEEESLALRRRIGDLRGLGFVLNNLGVTASRLGDLATARARHEESLAVKRQMGDNEGIGYSLRNLGEVALVQGDLDAAAAWYDEALHLTSRAGNRLVASSCVHGLGGVAGARGATDDAVRLFSAAEAWRDSFGLRLPERRRADDDRRIEAARVALGDEAFAALWAEGRSMPLTEVIDHAHAVAASSAPPAEPAASDNAIPLSAREREVAALLAQGLTNRQIAAELTVATSTVDRHVVNILRKLALTSRAHVAAWAVERGLATSTRRS